MKPAGRAVIPRGSCVLVLGSDTFRDLANLRWREPALR